MKVPPSPTPMAVRRVGVAIATALLSGACAAPAPELDSAPLQAAAGTRYPVDEIYSPLSQAIVDRLARAAGGHTACEPAGEIGPDGPYSCSWVPPADGPFIKVGDSITVDHGFMRCFEEYGPIWPEEPVSPEVSRDLLDRTVQAFSDMTIQPFGEPGTGPGDPYTRISQSACGGKWALWAMDPKSLYCSTNGIVDVDTEWEGGWPPDDEDRQRPPLQRELVRSDPLFALVMFGTNDLANDVTEDPQWYYHRGDWFADAYMRLVDELLAEGVIPVVFTIPPRFDLPYAQQRVAYHNWIIRAIAESRRVPLIDYHEALRTLIGPTTRYGLPDDKVHPSHKIPNACDFSETVSDDGLTNYPYGSDGQTLRNLLSIEMLARLRALILEGATSYDAAPEVLAGSGTRDNPVLADRLPFAVVDRIESGAASTVSSYNCPNGSTIDASAGERFYRVTAQVDGPLHVRVLTRVDAHDPDHPLRLDYTRPYGIVISEVAGEAVSDQCAVKATKYGRLWAARSGISYEIAVELPPAVADVDQEFTVIVWQ